MKTYQSSVNMGSTKSHDRKKSNRKILPKYYIVPLSVMKYATQNEYKSFDIGTYENLSGLKNI